MSTQGRARLRVRPGESPSHMSSPEEPVPHVQPGEEPVVHVEPGEERRHRYRAALPLTSSARPEAPAAVMPMIEPARRSRVRSRGRAIPGLTRSPP